MSWYAIEISEACILGGAYHRLCRAFQHAFIAAGAPPEMALLARRVGLGEARRVYISPASVPYLGTLLDEYRGDPCDCPEFDEVTLVYGVPGAKARLLVEARETASEPRPEAVPPKEVRREGVSIYPLMPARQAAAGA
jgi:hypothetical protein